MHPVANFYLQRLSDVWPFFKHCCGSAAPDVTDSRGMTGETGWQANQHILHQKCHNWPAPRKVRYVQELETLTVSLRPGTYHHQSPGGKGRGKTPQWGAADAEIKVPSGENTELKRSPFKAWSRSVYSHTCYAYRQGFLSCLFLHFRSIHLHYFSKTSPDFSLCWLWLRHGSCVGLQNKIDHPAG